MTRRSRFAVLAAPLALLALSSAAQGAVVISPLPGTPTAMPRTQISFLGAAAAALGNVQVVGSRSGRHSGHLRSYSSALGASFQPSKPFLANEHVSVHATLRVGKRTVRLATHFKVASPVTVPLSEFPNTAGTPADIQSFHSLPELHPPTVIVHQAASAESAPGYLLATPFLGPGQHGPMIFDNAGRLVWFRSLRGSEDAADLRTQVFHGKNALTWWQGHTLQLGYGLGEGVIANANYKTVAVVRAGNGLQADEHEFNLTSEGAAFVLAYSPVQANLTSAGGPAAGVAVDGVIQEIDIHTGLVMWEWHSLGHVDPAESYSKLPALASAPYDYFHINSLTSDHSGNLLISARNTWGIYLVNGRSGAIMWRLGGKRSSFKLGAGVPFAYQHNAMWLGKSEISLFDDEGAPAIAPPSRGELIKLDTKARTATLAGQLVRTIGPLTTNSQGNTQALEDGGFMVGWGGLPNLTEFDAHGQVIFDAQLPAGENSYRVYREPWAGEPSEAPALSASTSAGTTTAYASWNGATTVATWQLLGGASAAHLSVLASAPNAGFETSLSAPATAVVAVRALSAAGKELASTKALAPGGG